MMRRIVVAAALGAFTLAAAPIVAPQAGLDGFTAQAAKKKMKKAKKKKSMAGETTGGAKQMRMQANPAGSRFPYSYR